MATWDTLESETGGGGQRDRSDGWPLWCSSIPCVHIAHFFASETLSLSLLEIWTKTYMFVSFI